MNSFNVFIPRCCVLMFSCVFNLWSFFILRTIVNHVKDEFSLLRTHRIIQYVAELYCVFHHIVQLSL